MRTSEQASADGQSNTNAGNVVPPFEAADLARAREQAEAKLAEFFELETHLREQLNVEAWGAEGLRQIKQRVTLADAMFVDGRYRESLAEYAAAVGELAALIEHGNTVYDEAVARGRAALGNLDHEAAVAAFGEALAVKPDDAQARAGTEQAARLPRIVELLRQSDRAVLRGEYAAAAEHLAEVRSLDPATPGLEKRASEIADARATEQRRATLSEGFRALERGEYDAAIAAFNRVLKNDPSDADGLAGLQQAKQAELLARIDRLRGVAEQQEAEDRWPEALATYDEVLAIDPTLRFARDGKARIANRVALIETMARFIDDPGLLSDDQEFAKAKEALASALAEVGAGSTFQAQSDRLRLIVERSSVPVALVIDSDNQTEVMVQKVGFIGTFLRNELMLRPGRYVIVGSRDGYRDVREEIVLAHDSGPVEIRCTESI